MRKLTVLLCFALFGITLVMACKGPGALCTSDSDCCGAFVCNPWANRCTGGPGVGGPGGPWGPGGPAAAGIDRGPEEAPQ